MSVLLSLRKYAEHRKARGLPGGSLQAVQKAIASKRITLVVDPDSGKHAIDPDIADAQWVRNTDLDQQLRGNGGVLPIPAPGSGVWPARGGGAGDDAARLGDEGARGNAAGDGAADEALSAPGGANANTAASGALAFGANDTASGASGSDPSDREELLRHRTEAAEIDNELKRLELAKRRGELVSLADEREVRTRRYRAIRDKGLGLPDREAAVMAAKLKCDPVQLHAELTRMMKTFYQELADDARIELDAARSEAARGPGEPMAA